MTSRKTTHMLYEGSNVSFSQTGKIRAHLAVRDHSLLLCIFQLLMHCIPAHTYMHVASIEQLFARCIYVYGRMPLHKMCGLDGGKMSHCLIPKRISLSSSKKLHNFKLIRLSHAALRPVRSAGFGFAWLQGK